jgi:hypothetical protein
MEETGRAMTSCTAIRETDETLLIVSTVAPIPVPWAAQRYVSNDVTGGSVYGQANVCRRLLNGNVYRQ